MNTYFTSDVHFGHNNILKKFCPDTRQGVDVDDMNRIIIHNWKKQVRPEDHVWLLGDIFFINDVNICANILRQLPGILHLVYGNHDKIIRNNQYLQDFFTECVEWADIMLKPPGMYSNTRDQRVILHHYPTYEWKDMHKGAFHLYGHIHSKYGLEEHPFVTGRAMDAGIDSRPNKDMTLWSWEEVYQNLIQRKIRGHHEAEL
jgi:calcineurin-like phosphoesterase family protein